MASLSKMVGTVLGSAAITAISVSKVAAVPEAEPNDTFPGQAATVGTEIQGSLHASGSTPDLIDFFHYTGLPAGDLYDLSFQHTCCSGALQAAQYTDQTTIADGGTKFVESVNSLVHLQGNVPGSGEMVFGVTLQGLPAFESYNVTLNVTPGAVPEPASIALLAVGLTALGADVARRRKRG